MQFPFMKMKNPKTETDMKRIERVFKDAWGTPLAVLKREVARLEAAAKRGAPGRTPKTARLAGKPGVDK